MALSADQKKDIIDKYQLHGQDSGSAEVQIALLTERIRQLVLDPELRTRMGQKGREIVENEFSMEMMTECVTAIYRRGINGILQK